MDVLFNFKLVQIFEYKGVEFSFGVPVTAWASKFCSNLIWEIFFVVGWGVVSYNNLILSEQEKCDDMCSFEKSNLQASVNSILYIVETVILNKKKYN